MNLQMDVSLAKGYKSPSQVAKILTENWIAQESYCPSCLNTLTQAKANSRVLDFTCKGCEFDFELKSKKGIFSKKITDGAYGAMIERLAQPSSPHFFFMNYSPDFKVQNLVAVPAYFIQSSVIERRNPLSQSAKRAGWVGCNILSEKIPEAGKIVLIKNSVIIDREKVKKKWSQTSFLRAAENIDSRSWTLDVLLCIEKLETKSFSLQQVYQFECELAIKHPNNNHIKHKIRQQLQVLRDKGVLDFVSRGNYKLVSI